MAAFDYWELRHPAQSTFPTFIPGQAAIIDDNYSPTRVMLLSPSGASVRDKYVLPPQCAPFRHLA
ncbi:hypothetical protein ARMGADRAFT_287938 [Armillaria gallica]|uniref:Uncharacterized protein n=1 Tax=Armillaria gallica TaxID=47427 RepID=A0A2H3DI33_ARMGA|nr:hypothetical protein ARMGADRAFT_287938 [Armillaria gallica]